MNTKKKVLAGTMVGSLAVGGFAFGRFTQVERVRAEPVSTEPAAAVTTPSGRALPSFASLAAQASPTVVNVKVVAVEKTAQMGPQFGFPPNPFGGEESPFPGFRSPFPPTPPGGFRRQGSGSGFIVREDGVILTNNHVVENAKEITVTLADKHEYSAKVLGRDPKTDLAVIKIDAKGDLPVAKLGDSGALQVGDWVMAIGNPFGLSNTVTAGIVSAKGRVIGAGPYDDFIQTDASINPGNSGGPLFNEQGEVIGINSAIFSQTGGNVGIGFAIPINLAKQLLPELETKGSVTRGWLGVTIQKVTPELAKSLGIDEAHGALVADVTQDSPADKAGVKRGDVIIAYNGKKIADASSLPVLVAATPVEKTVPVEVLRNGKGKTLDVTISKLNDKEVAMEEPTAAKGKLGLALRDLQPEERKQLSLKKDEGVVVEEVMPDSPAAEAGIQAGDVILQVNQTAVGSVAELTKAVRKAEDDQPLLFLLRRADGNNQFVTLAAK
jgi:serine protease Do